MRGVRLPVIVAGVLLVAVVAGCGGAALVDTTTDNSLSQATTTFDGKTSPDNSSSAGYCQRLDDGEWVTNDSASSTTPCVPAPAYATGNEQADDSIAIPRCATCKLPDWGRAEKRRSRTSQIASTSANETGAGGWPPQVRSTFVDKCSSGGDDTPCDCLADQLALTVPAFQVAGLSLTDSRVQAAFRNCGAPPPAEGG